MKILGTEQDTLYLDTETYALIKKQHELCVPSHPAMEYYFNERLTLVSPQNKCLSALVTSIKTVCIMDIEKRDLYPYSIYDNADQILEYLNTVMEDDEHKVCPALTLRSKIQLIGLKLVSYDLRKLC